MQAVVLADSFASNFRPVTFQQPKVLMPLVNVPMLEYTCEFLAAGGMHEIFILLCFSWQQRLHFIHVPLCFLKMRLQRGIPVL